jgi:hypothetical protein
MTAPLRILELNPAKLHFYFPFIRRGLEDILRKNTPRKMRVGPSHEAVPLPDVLVNTKVRYRPEDVYAALAYNRATAYLVSRNRRLLGFFIVHPQPINFTDKTELFLWTAWALPIRERRPQDDFPDAIRRSIAFLAALKEHGKHAELTMLTMRPGFLRREPYRQWFEPQFTSFFLKDSQFVKA